MSAAAVLVIAASNGWAASDRVMTERTETSLASEMTGVSPGAVTWFILDQKIKPGWHVYWMNPGDSGLPLDLQWRLPHGFSAGSPFYPLPERILIDPLVDFGHKESALFLIPVAVPSDAEVGIEIQATLTATWLICSEICVPETADFSLVLPVEGAPRKDPAWIAAFADARASQPQALAGAIVKPGAKYFEIEAPVRSRGAEAFFFSNADGVVEPSAPQRARFSARGVKIRIKGGHSYTPTAPDFSGVLVVTGKDGRRRGYEFSTPIIEGWRAKAAPVGFLLLTAFLGGMLLNVMPCVFPVVFIKAAHALKNAQSSRAAAAREGLLYAAGVVFTFSALGALLLALRAGGEAVGWGFQLQSPAVVTASAYVLFAVGLNLAGVFHVGESLQNIGADTTRNRRALGSFLTGALAVFVAAPCVGPLLSAPMGAALLLPAPIGFAIFATMGAGLAAPYLALSSAPGLARFLPRPGAWLPAFKQALSIPVFAGAAYFLYVLSAQAGSAGLASALSGLLLLGTGAWLFELSKGLRRQAPARLGALGLVLLSVGLIATVRDAPKASSGAMRHGVFAAEPFDRARIEVLRSEGKGVFVDFTAAWCATCQLDRITVFSNLSLAEEFDRKRVVFMVADWTHKDAAIAAALQSFRASGVPFYVYFPPEGDARIVTLPIGGRKIREAISS